MNIEEYYINEDGVTLPANMYGKIINREIYICQKGDESHDLQGRPLYYLALFRLSRDEKYKFKTPNNVDVFSARKEIINYIRGIAIQYKLLDVEEKAINKEDKRAAYRKWKQLIACFDIMYGFQNNEILELAEDLKSFSQQGKVIKIQIGDERPLKIINKNTLGIFKQALTEKLFACLFENKRIESYLSDICWEGFPNGIDNLKLSRDSYGNLNYSPENPKPLSITNQGLAKIIRNEKKNERQQFKKYVTRLYDNLLKAHFIKATSKVDTSSGCFIYDALSYLHIITGELLNKSNQGKRDYIRNCFLNKKDL
ncbi:hypothetical protein M2463_000666 [Parabacteroides sp. PH5-13]|uniref:hypothetical protein n=1 Tax=unclassified Parabacteroides TaxID=2649774 RepID=UPI0024755CA5|nr:MULTISPECIES: hypothetical protein [unclassified Parabacteroides]MDH6304279.1 hypothetical protein [Parabacteroides sp. PH5-39]MDH6318666.1 hypothetical protein [Parabacteroides sp. PH5-13]MDH6322396.1 hypothetical protein [Parabacteroides sp. PH5-8]MDH6383779.1 hypothetical protein [Parabacteroides sp. PH5-17]MDH6392887.1 hypothetical protein [Parabacteroides sp. PFB2-22]